MKLCVCVTGRFCGVFSSGGSRVHSSEHTYGSGRVGNRGMSIDADAIKWVEPETTVTMAVLRSKETRMNVLVLFRAITQTL